MFFLPIKQESNSYSICIKNNSDIYEILHKKLDGSNFSNGKLNILQVKESYKKCSLLYLGNNLDLKDITDIKKYLLNQKVLIVSKKGINKPLAMIILKTKGNKIKFDANKTLMETFKIQLSSKVLRLADEVF
ncbi:hypothetical protein A9Q84_07945 [Halobacteriovorax marinus]|uniref:YfiR family protein n=1 Tax=Halobacteriovorax marinus TaxID=97084 RepID=A0A1Y5FBP4_9BACT|nr:hypothetical protein A9Q84_07945 [Halobacteriovorax marinus]